MSPSEIAFLAVGLIIGAAVGAAIAEAIRVRPAPRRQVRVTISPNTVSPRRSLTLAEAAGDAGHGAVPGGPEEGALWDEAGVAGPGGSSIPGADPLPAAPTRTRVPSASVTLPAGAVGIPIATADEAPATGGPAVATAAPTFMGAPRGAASAPPSAVLEGAAAGITVATTRVGVLEPASTPAVAPAPAASPARPLPSSVEVGATPAHLSVRLRGTRPDARPVLAAGAVAVPVEARAATTIRPVAMDDPSAAGALPAASPSIDPIAADPCETPRRLVEERCALATTARDNAKAAAEAVRDAQRRYDALREHLDRAQQVADPREVATTKDELHAAFRAANDAARTAEEAELAARQWLDAINEVNRRAREAARFIETASNELRAALPRIERLALDADAARITADTADAACHDARERLAACEETGVRAGTGAVPAPGGEPSEPHPFDALWPGESEHTRTQPLTGAEAEEASVGLPVVIRVLQGDRDARDRLVASLAGTDPDATRTWGLRLSALFDAITARAIEDGYLDLPPDDPFWGLFSFPERREIVTALSALGYRYDGMRAFADGRSPAGRDLSLAVGYAGLDRMRIRTWPGDPGTLYERATVAADEWLADHADDLSLGQMVEALGPRAGDFADVWNAWGRVRPALLAD